MLISLLRNRPELFQKISIKHDQILVKLQICSFKKNPQHSISLELPQNIRKQQKHIKIDYGACSMCVIIYP